MFSPRTTLSACWLFALLLPAGAEPDLRTARPAGPCSVYRDSRRADLFYYGPGEIVLRQGPDGKPDLHFLQTRYTGTATGGDRGTQLYRSLLSFGVVMSGPSLSEVQLARQALLAEGLARRPELQPLPIQRLEAALVYVTLAAGASEGPAQALPGGHFEPAGSSNALASTAYWSERTYTLSLDPNTAQAFGEALQKGQVLLSLAYAFHALGIAPDQPLAELTGSPALVAALRRQLDERQGNPDGTAGRAAHLVRAGATAITLDAGRWKDLCRQIDLNASAPPGYGALDIYCYDFNNALRPDLYEKQVELRAETVGGRPVTLTTRFQSSQPDLFARSVRFSVAVRLDRPYRYRVVDITEAGETMMTAWQERTSWAPILDVTSPPKRDPAGAAGGNPEEKPHESIH